VAFVSVTDGPRDGAEQFARTFSVPWPCGYGAAPAALAHWGACEGNTAVSPTLYLVGPDGCVLWCDGRARMHHGLNPAVRDRDLEMAIERALAGLADDRHHTAANLPSHVRRPS
jgi:hypothetical protein